MPAAPSATLRSVRCERDARGRAATAGRRRWSWVSIRSVRGHGGRGERSAGCLGAEASRIRLLLLDQRVEVRLGVENAELDGEAHRAPRWLSTSTSDVNSGSVMPAAASSGMSRFVDDRVAHGLCVGRCPLERLRHRRGEVGDELGIGVDQLLRRDVGQQRQTGNRGLVGLDDDVAAGADDLRQNGSGTHAASMFPASSCAGASGKATSTNSIVEGSPPSSCTAFMIVTSPAAPRLLTDTFLPARSVGVVMPESARDDDGVDVGAVGEASSRSRR